MVQSVLLQGLNTVRTPIGRRPRVARDLTEAVGHVPMIRMNRVSRVAADHDLYLKMESCNPGGSIKEKNAVYLVKKAEERGELRSGGTIIESSSGNFGMALAMVGAVRGYRVIIVIDAKTAPAMKRMLIAYGAELVTLPVEKRDANGSMQVARMEKAAELARTIPGAWYPCQHKNPENPDVHALQTGPEIVEMLGEAPDAVVIGVSTAGQVAGMARYFRRHHPRTRIVAVDVAGSVVLGTPAHSYKMTGLGLSFVPPNFDGSLMDEAYSIPDRLAFSLCHQLARKEGLLLGGSTGAIVAAGLAHARAFSRRQRVALINPDRGDRYLETIYDQGWLEEQGIELLREEELEDAVAELRPVPRESRGPV